MSTSHAGVLTVRKSKFGKSRYIPVHESTRQSLGNYAAQRDRLCPTSRSPGFFLSEHGARISEWALRWTFVKLSRQVGLRGPSDSAVPVCMTCAIDLQSRTLLRWYRVGIDVERHLPRLDDLPRACARERHLLVPHGHPGADATCCPPTRSRRKEAADMKTADFPRLLAAFFTDRLMQQLQASPHTIASYRDTFRLLVRHARKMLKKDPTELELGDLDTDFLGAFLSHLEDQRGNDARTRNTRLAANPFLLRLRRIARAPTRGLGAAGPGHAEQTPYPPSGGLSQPGRSRGLAASPGPADTGGTP